MQTLRPHADPQEQNLCVNMSPGYLLTQRTSKSTAQGAGMRKWEPKCWGSGGYWYHRHHFTSVAFPLYVGMRKIRKKHWRLFAEDSIKPKA